MVPIATCLPAYIQLQTISFYIRDEIKEKDLVSGIYTHSGQGILNVFFSLTQVALFFSLIVFYFTRPVFQGYGLPWHSKV